MPGIIALQTSAGEEIDVIDPGYQGAPVRPWAESGEALTVMRRIEDIDPQPETSRRPAKGRLPKPDRHHVPGEEGVWVVIFGDLIVFALFFVTYCYYRAISPDLFSTSQQQLNQTIGMANTFLLLTSSWFVASATARAKAGAAHADRFILGAIACGGAFVAVKFFEYREKILAGTTLTTNEFFTFYFMYTGIHLIHVIVGMGVLTYLYLVARRPSIGTDGIRMIEGGGAFWHLVDVLWIILFALLYVAR